MNFYTQVEVAAPDYNFAFKNQQWTCNEAISETPQAEFHLVKCVDGRKYTKLEQLGCFLLSKIFSLFRQTMASRVWRAKAALGCEVIVACCPKKYLKTLRVADELLKKSFSELDFDTYLAFEAKVKAAAQDPSPQAKLLVKKFVELTHKHKVLRELQEYRNLLKRPESKEFGFSIEERKLFTFLPPDTTLDEVRKDRAKWEQIRRRIWNAAQEAEPFLLQKRNITWITGSRSAAVPMMLKVSKQLGESPRLMPTGQLLRHNFVPLTGELSMGLDSNGVNLSSLSGMGLPGLSTCLEYATAPAYVFNAENELKSIMELQPETILKFGLGVDRVKVAVLRLLLTNQLPEKWPKIKKHLTKMISEFDQIDPNNLKKERNWKTLAPLIGQPVPADLALQTPEKGEQLKVGQIVAVPRSEKGRAFGMVVAIDKNGNYKVAVEGDGTTKTVSPSLLKIAKKSDLNRIDQKPTSETFSAVEEKMKTHSEKLAEIIDLFDKVEPLKFSRSEKELIDHSFPLIWGACGIKPQHFKNGVPNERTISGVVELGQDIPIAFTEEKDKEKLQKIVSPYGVEVLSFDAARYIMTQQCRFTEYDVLEA